MPIIDITSKSEVRRAIANRGLKIDGVIIDDEKKNSIKRFKKIFKLSYGKKKHYLVKIISSLFLSIIFWMNLGVIVLIGFIVFFFPFGPFILKLIPKSPSPTSLVLQYFQLQVFWLLFYLKFSQELMFL